MTLPDAFLKSVQRLPGDHWGWDGPRAYGRLHGAPQYRGKNAARFAYEDRHGTMPEATPYVKATCGVRDCLNPDHLTPTDDVVARTSKGVPIAEPTPGPFPEMAARIESLEKEVADLRTWQVDELIPGFVEALNGIRARLDVIERAMPESDEPVIGTL